jgi:hypothetical protein
LTRRKVALWARKGAAGNSPNRPELFYYLVGAEGFEPSTPAV